MALAVREGWHLEFPDVGCDLAPTCEGCPFPQCRYDHPRGIQGLLDEQKDRQRLREWARHKGNVRAFAKKHNVKRDAIYKMLRRNGIRLTPRKRSARRHGVAQAP